jgi:uncharacterized membrane protein
MANKLILYVLFALALVFSASASISIQESSVAMNVVPGTTNATPITVWNTDLTQADNIGFNATVMNDVPSTGVTIPASALTESPSVLSLPSGGSSAVALMVSAPANQKAGLYQTIVSAVHNSTAKDTVLLSITVLPVPSYTVASTSPSIVQGLSGSMIVNISNTGNAALSGVQYAVSDFTSGSNTLSVSGSKTGTVSVAYAGSSALTFLFNPSSSLPIGTYSGHINTTYGGVVTTTQLALNVVAINRAMTGTATNAALVINRVSSTVYGMTPGSLVLTNTGNYALTGVNIQLTNLSGPTVIQASNVFISDNNFALGIGASKTVTLTPLGLSGTLPAGTYTGNIVISYGGTSTLTKQFSIVVSDAHASISMPEVLYPASEREVNVSQSITISNNGDFALNNIQLTSTVTNTWITGSVPGSLAVGGSFLVTVTSTVPKSVNAGPTKIGELVFTSTEYTARSAIKTNVPAKLAFDSVKISIDDNSYKSVDNGESISDDAKPGSTFAVKVKIENLFTNDEDITMEDVKVDATFFAAGEDGEDIEGDSESVDIDGGEKSSELTIDFDSDTIDWDASSGDLKMELIATGEDEKGGAHKATFNFTVKIERESNSEIIFSRFDVPTSISCGRTFTVYVDGRNIGEDKDGDVLLKIQGEALGISIEENFAMGAYDGDEDCNAIEEDEDSECREFQYTKTVQVPSDIAPGTYTIYARLYRDNGDKQTDEDSQDVTVVCGGTTTTTTTTTTPTTSTTTTTPTTSTTTSTTTTKPATTGTTSGTTSSVEIMYGTGRPSSTTRGAIAATPTRISDTTRSGGSGFTASTGYIALLSLLSVAAIIAIIGLIIYGATKPKE